MMRGLSHIVLTLLLLGAADFDRAMAQRDRGPWISLEFGLYTADGRPITSSDTAGYAIHAVYVPESEFHIRIDGVPTDLREVNDTSRFRPATVWFHGPGNRLQISFPGATRTVLTIARGNDTMRVVGMQGVDSLPFTPGWIFLRDRYSTLLGIQPEAGVRIHPGLHDFRTEFPADTVRLDAIDSAISIGCRSITTTSFELDSAFMVKMTSVWLTTVVAVPTSNVLIAIAFTDVPPRSTAPDDNRPRSLIARSTDRGRSWKRLRNPIEDAYLVGIHFRDGRNGWMHGTDYAAAFYAKTTDGGVTWRRSNAPPDSVWSCVLPFQVNELRGNVAITGDVSCRLETMNGYPHPLLFRRSADGGVTWTTQLTITGSPPLGFLFADSNLGYIVFSNGVLRTDDAGRTWRFTPLSLSGGCAMSGVTSLRLLDRETICLFDARSIAVVDLRDDADR